MLSVLLSVHPAERGRNRQEWAGKWLNRAPSADSGNARHGVIIRRLEVQILSLLLLCASIRKSGRRDPRGRTDGGEPCPPAIRLGRCARAIVPFIADDDRVVFAPADGRALRFERYGIRRDSGDGRTACRAPSLRNRIVSRDVGDHETADHTPSAAGHGNRPIRAPASARRLSCAHAIARVAHTRPRLCAATNRRMRRRLARCASPFECLRRRRWRRMRSPGRSARGRPARAARRGTRGRSLRTRLRR